MFVVLILTVSLSDKMTRSDEGNQHDTHTHPQTTKQTLHDR